MKIGMCRPNKKREKLNEDIQAFLDSGGVVEQIPTGVGTGGFYSKGSQSRSSKKGRGIIVSKTEYQR